MRNIEKCIFSLLLFLSLFSFPGYSFAGVGLEPEKVEIIAKKGEEIKGTIIAYNNETQDLDVSVYLENWFKQEIKPEKWLRLEPVNFHMKPGEKQEVKYTINVPKDFSGELMCMSFFPFRRQSGPIAGVEMTIPFYVAIEGTMNLKVNILSCDLEAKGDRLEGVVLIENKGNVHIRPDVKAILENKEKGFNVTGFVWPGRSIKPGDYKSFPFTIKNPRDIPEKCTVKVVVFYGVGGGFDNMEEKTFEVDIKKKPEIFK